MFTSTTGSVSDSSVILFNRVPFLEIEYPIPYKLKDYKKKRTSNTETEWIKKGINFYDEIMDIRLRNETTTAMNNSEMDELKNILKGGVIYNSNWS